MKFDHWRNNMSSKTIYSCDQCGQAMHKKSRQKITFTKEKILQANIKGTQSVPDWGTETFKTKDICNDCFAHALDVLKNVLTEDSAWEKDVFAEDD